MKLLLPLMMSGAVLSLTTGCATTSAVTNIVKQQAKKSVKKAAVDVAKQKVVEAVTTQKKTNESGVEMSGGVVKQSATQVQVQTAKKAKSGMLGIRATVPAMKKTYGKPKRLAGIIEWVVPFYRINYLTNSNYKNASNNSYTAASAKVLSSLEGVSSTVFDEITEIAYTDFKDKMAVAGYTVKPHAGFASVQKIMAKGKYPTMGKSAYKSVPKGVTSASGANSTAAMKVEMKENVNVLEVILDANFVINNRNEKKFNIMQSKETVYSSQGANIMGGVKIRMPRTEIRFEIGQPPYSQIAFGVMEDVTKGGDKVGDAAVAVTGLLFGGGQLRRSTTKRKLVRAEEAKYKEAMVDALKQANTMIVDKMASYK